MPSTVSTITFKKDKPDPVVAAEGSPTLSLEEAARLGLINFGDLPAADETPSESTPEDTKKELVSFEDAIKRGLLDFGDRDK